MSGLARLDLHSPICTTDEVSAPDAFADVNAHIDKSFVQRKYCAGPSLTCGTQRYVVLPGS